MREPLAQTTIRPARQVSAAILLRDNQLLLARRLPRQGLGGYWELPGGKCEAGETPAACLRRELAEELCISARIGACFSRTFHRYPRGLICTHSLFVASYHGQLLLREHDQLAWVAIPRLLDYRLTPANVPIVQRLQAWWRQSG